METAATSFFWFITPEPVVFSFLPSLLHTCVHKHTHLHKHRVSHTLTHFHRTQPYTLTYTYTNPNPITHTHLFYSFRLTSIGLYIPVQLWGDHWPINVCAPLGYWTFKNLNKQTKNKQTKQLLLFRRRRKETFSVLICDHQGLLNPQEGRLSTSGQGLEMEMFPDPKARESSAGLRKSKMAT